MNIVELQNNIIRLVLETSDDEILHYLNGILQKENYQAYILNDSEKFIIQESIKAYSKVDVIEHDELISRNKKWLEE
jgi:hypothetical protein